MQGAVILAGEGREGDSGRVTEKVLFVILEVNDDAGGRRSCVAEVPEDGAQNA